MNNQEPPTTPEEPNGSEKPDSFSAAAASGAQNEGLPFEQEQSLNGIGSEIPESLVDQQKQENELFEEKNKKGKSKHKHFIFIGSLYILWGIAIILLLIRVYHFVAPYCFHWLDIDQIHSLDKLLASGTVGTILGRYGNSLFSEK